MHGRLHTSELVPAAGGTFRAPPLGPHAPPAAVCAVGHTECGSRVLIPDSEAWRTLALPAQKPHPCLSASALPGALTAELRRSDGVDRRVMHSIPRTSG